MDGAAVDGADSDSDGDAAAAGDTLGADEATGVVDGVEVVADWPAGGASD